MKEVVCLIIVTMTLLGGAASSYATPIVAPNALATSGGNTNNCIPTTGCLDFDRYQQVFNATEFAATPGPVLISQIAFRREFAGSFSNTFSNVVVGLSTTSASADGLSSTFASNTGADYTQVRSGALMISSASTAGGLTPFDVIINFSTAFLYDSSLGNLLLDWQNFGSEAFPTGSLDAHD